MLDDLAERGKLLATLRKLERPFCVLAWVLPTIVPSGEASMTLLMVLAFIVLLVMIAALDDNPARPPWSR
jgi:hypothetical protein